jgi:chromosomal replication initiation ATPase DnaA
MKIEKEVHLLFKNIADSIDKTSIKGLNNNLTDYLSKNGNISNEANIVLKEVCDDFNISIKTLMSKNARATIQDAKQTAYCILHNGLRYTISVATKTTRRKNF